MPSYIDSFILAAIAITSVGFGSYFAGTSYSKLDENVFSVSRIKNYPYISAASLISINLLMELFGPSYVNYYLATYFLLAGTNCAWCLVRTFSNLKTKKLFTFPYFDCIFTELALPKSPIPFCIHDIPIWVGSLVLNLLYYKTHNTLINNIIAFSISTYAVLSIKIQSFASAAPMLWGLLIYDVFFVYSTDVMSAVANTLDGPVKLMFPNANGSYSILGLGDIVVPGMFIAVCSRFDNFLYEVANIKSPYWCMALIAYCISLFITDYVCYKTGEGQPALLFIVPVVTITSVLTAIIRGEYLAFLTFTG